MLEIPRQVDKPWGYELIWAETEDYVGKILHVKAGEASSLHYHEIKDETLFLMNGQLSLQAGHSKEELLDFEMVEGQSFHVHPRMVHRIIATSDCDIFEVSTPHLDDIVRLEDRYERVPRDSA